MRPFSLPALPGSLVMRWRSSLRRARFPALALLAALPACRALAQEAPPAPPEPGLVRADSVVVTATRSERSAEDVPVSVTVVPRETIENAPSRTLDDALRNVVGLNLPLGSSNTIQPTTNHVSMRGLGGDRALVLLDGVPLNDAVNGYVQWNKAPLGTVERVEVVRGSAASLFGNYAMGGTVSIFSRPLDGSRVEADASYGTFDTKRLNASVTESLGGGWNAGVFLDMEDTDGYTRAIPEERGTIDVPSWSRSVNLQVKAEAKGSSGSRFFVKGNLLDHDLSQGTRLAKTHRRMYDVSAGGRFGLGGAEVSATAFYQDATYDVDNTQLVPGSGRDAEYLANLAENPGQDAGGSLQWSRGVNGILTFLAFGLDAHRASSNDSVVSFDRFGNQTGTRTNEGHQTFAGLFGEASFLPASRLEVLASARLDSWRNSGGREETSTTGPTTYEDRSTTRLNPRLSIRYELQDGFAFRGSVYRGFRAPTLKELYRGAVTKTTIVLSNPALGPETLVGGDVGADFTAKGFRGELNLFLNEIDGLIARETLALKPALVVQPRNLGAGRSRGVEVMGTFALGRAVSADAGYAFTDSVITDNPANPGLVGNQIPDVSRHAGSLGLTWAPGQGPSVAFRGRALSRRYADDSNLLAMDPHVVLDLFGSYPIAKALEAFASVENLLDREYVSDANVGRRLGPPRAVFVGLRLRQPLHPASSARSQVP
ncbi:MAG: TonB-dependent receptor [Holophagales bacterium]|nr:TonB-dependent receptor [Holophagales bacterium]